MKKNKILVDLATALVNWQNELLEHQKCKHKGGDKEGLSADTQRIVLEGERIKSLISDFTELSVEEEFLNVDKEI